MAWLSVGGLFDLIDRSGSTPWHIVVGQTIVVPTRHEMSLHGEFRIEGAFRLDGTARLELRD